MFFFQNLPNFYFEHSTKQEFSRSNTWRCGVFQHEFLKKITFFVLIFFVFIDYFDVLMSKINF
jgi:hypothetical protein